MSEPTSCCRARGSYCERCDVLVGLDGLHVTAVERDDGGRLVVAVESEPTVMGCPACGVVAHGHGRVEVASGRRPGYGPAGADHLAEAALAVPRAGCPVRSSWSRTSGRRSALVLTRRAAGGRSSRSAASTRRSRGPPPARHGLADGVGRDQATAAGHGRRPLPLRRA